MYKRQVTGCVDGYINDALRGNTPIRETEVGKSDSGDSGYGKPDNGRQGPLFHHQVSQKIGTVGYSDVYKRQVDNREGSILGSSIYDDVFYVMIGL